MSDPELNMPETSDVGDKPRRGRPPKSKVADAESAQPYKEFVTYLPGKEDSVETKWGGVTFHANVPKELTAHAEGTPHERAMHAIIEKARNNKFFHVGEFDPANAVVAREKTAMPKTSEQYRSWVVNWLQGLSSEGELDQKWISEEPLRQACDVGTDDLEWLGTLIAPKRHELRKLGMAA